MNIKQLIKEAYQNSIDHGFYDCPECGGRCQFPQCDHPGCYNHVTHPCEGCGRIQGKCNTCKGIGSYNDVGQMLMLIICELAEAVEAHRKKRSYAELCEQHTGYKNGYDGKSFLDYYIDSDQNNCVNGNYDIIIKNTIEDELADVFIRLFDLCGWLYKEDAAIKNLCRVINRLEREDDKDIYKIIEIKSISVGILELVNMVCTYSDNKTIPNLAGLILLVQSFCKVHKIDIEKHIAAKMAYNKTRPHKHDKEY